MKKFLVILSLCFASIVLAAKEESGSPAPNCDCPQPPKSPNPDRGPKRAHEPSSTPPSTSTPCVCPSTSSAPSHGK